MSVSKTLLLLMCLFIPKLLLADQPEFNPRMVIPRAFPAIVKPKTMTAEKADEVLEESELVIGVTVDGESRAYPLNMLTGPKREIINDELGGTAIVVTWCHLCHNGIVYHAEVKGKKLMFLVSGMLWRRNLVMQDMETKSLWSHMLGKAMRGPLEGAILERIRCEMTDWKSWREEHPDTSVLSMSRTSRNYRKEFYMDPKQFVFGYVSGDHARAWSFDQLLQQPVVNDRFHNTEVLIVYDPDSTAAWMYERRVNDQVLTFERSGGLTRDRETGSVWDPAKGRSVGGLLMGKTLTPLAGIVAYRAAWRDFHPDSSYWVAKSADSGSSQ